MADSSPHELELTPEFTVADEPQNEKELDRLHTCLRRGQPYGDETWTRRTAVKLGLESSLHPVGRPRKAIGKAEE